VFAELGQTRTRRLLSSLLSVPEADLGTPVRLRPVRGDDGDEMVASWRRFSAELKSANRWFPAERDSALDVLERLLPSHTIPLARPQVLFRARIGLSDERFRPDQMRMPPASRARAGRANPSGIPYLYAASSVHTAIKECRPVHNCLVSVAEFSTDRELSILDLTATLPADPFATALGFPDGATWESYATAVTSYQLRKVIGSDLSRPVRPNEGEPDYSATQFLCEYAKSRGCDGVRYGSAVDPGNWNVVLFDDRHLDCRSIERYEITALDVTTAVVLD
jgi:RES domain-containing protein